MMISKAKQRWFINDTEVHENTFKHYYDKEFKRSVINAHKGCKYDYKILKHFFDVKEVTERKELNLNGIKFMAYIEERAEIYN